MPGNIGIVVLVYDPLCLLLIKSARLYAISVPRRNSIAAMVYERSGAWNRHFCNLLAKIEDHININTKKLQFIHSVNGDGSKTAKIIKKVILPTITLPECQRDAE